MNIEHKEKRSHGTSLFPFHIYSHTASQQYFVFYHWHEEVEFIYVEEGEMEVIVNKETYQLLKNEFILIQPGTLHQIQSNKASIHHAIVFHPHILDFQNFDLVQNSILKPLQDGVLQYPQSIENPVYNEIIQKQLLEILKYGKQDTTFSMLQVKIKLLEMISFLYEHYLFIKSEDDEKQTYHLERIKMVITYMEKHYQDQITLEKLASLLNMNEHYFCRYFKKYTGISCISYLIQLRIEKSAELLCTTKLKVLDVAMSCGFDNISYFIRTFRFYKTLTPNAYRKRFQIK